MEMYNVDYLMEILHRNIYEYALMDGYDEKDIDDDFIRDFLYNKLQERRPSYFLYNKLQEKWE